MVGIATTCRCHFPHLACDLHGYVFYRVCAEWGPIGVGQKDNLCRSSVRRLATTQRVSTIAIIGETPIVNGLPLLDTSTRMVVSVTGAKIASQLRRTCSTYPPTIKIHVSTNATQELTTTLEIDVIVVLVRILRQFPHAPVDLPLQEVTHAKAKIWIRAHGVDLLAVVIRSPLAAVAITNLETAVTIAQQESIHRVGQLLHVIRARVADTVLQNQVRVVCVLREHILRRRHQVVQPCRVDTLRLPVGHVLRRSGGRVTRHNKRMRRAQPRAIARASARQDIGGAARRLG